ncbi:EamA family transporter [Gordonia alkanivorans]|uniref:EamA family transporter n=2 Tax=Gordonia alkanivorans TaxID=84096 RepID=UPI0024495519|nr:EamA family transporter [Gordonia alkanivorans]MDH3044920.1 EamA family transporter [Gordonia alkanivorans]
MSSPVQTRGRSRPSIGIALALFSSACFAISGVLARAMIESGWSAGATVTVRIAVGAAVLAIPGLVAFRDRQPLLPPPPQPGHRSGWVVIAYGLLAVAGCQLAYFYAVTYLQVGVALLIEYTAPVAVLVWMWLRHAQRPTRVTVFGAALALAGLALVLDLTGEVSISVVGVLWALAAMVGAAAYFVISADERTGLPPLALAAGGLVIGAITLATAGLVGALPMTASTSVVRIGDLSLPWWAPLLMLGVVSAAMAYAFGIAAGRILGARVMSFVALSEVLFAVLFAWLALDELPAPIQLLGGLLIVAGVVFVRLGEAP